MIEPEEETTSEPLLPNLDSYYRDYAIRFNRIINPPYWTTPPVDIGLAISALSVWANDFTTNIRALINNLDARLRDVETLVIGDVFVGEAMTDDEFWDTLLKVLVKNI